MTSSDALHVQNSGLRRTGGRGHLAPTKAVVILEGNPLGVAAIQSISPGKGHYSTTG
jgi:hypothetical protein